jgi:choline monooxygenase
MDLQIHPDITQASTLPSTFYSDPAVFQACKERIFARSWQLVGDLDPVKAPGHVHPLTMLEGFLDEPIILSRDDTDSLHCLSNVCTHRGNIVCDHGGRERFLTCCYHGRRFALDGTFRSMPEFEQAKGFPSPKDNLPKIPFGTWGKFVFASINPLFPLNDLLGDMQVRLGWLPHDQLAFEPSRSKDYLVRANWALYCDNYLEGFHIPFVHASLADTLDYGSYRTELYKWSNLQLGIAKGGEDAFDLPASSPDLGQHIGAYYYWLFPNTMINVYPWGVSVNVVRPLAPDLSKVSFLTYVWDRARLDRGAGSGLDRVEREDEFVVEAVQRGVRSRLYDRGRYSPTREQGVHHFHRLLAQCLVSMP